jgi:Uma2 family endonuclease
MSVTAAPLTVEAFLKLPEPPGEKIELIHGEVISVGRGGYLHEKVKSNLIRILNAWVLQHRTAEVFSETMFRLDEHNSPIPDVSLVLSHRLVPGFEGHLAGAPDLAVEVVSSEAASDLERKISLYLAHGSRAVWVAFPRQRLVRVYDATGASRKLSSEDRLEAPELLPGFSVPVATVFEGV